MKAPGRYAVVTAISPNMWADYLLFHASLRKNNSFQLIVIGLGLDRNQQEFVSKQLETTLINFVGNAHFQTIGRDWRKWYKPYFIISALDQVDVMLWLDADLIVLKELDALFEAAADSFFVIQDFFAPFHCLNHADVYAQFGLEAPQNWVLNSGVIGLSIPRDAYIIERWFTNVQIIHQNPDMIQKVALYDQGVLLLTIHQLQLTNQIKTNRDWNCPGLRLLGSPFVEPLEQAVLDHPKATIVHYAGVPKLSQLQTLNHEITGQYYRQVCGEFKTKRLFVTGFETMLDDLTKSLRQGSRLGGWFHNLDMPALALLAQQKKSGKSVEWDRSLLANLGRADCPTVIGLSSYFGCLLEEMTAIWPDAQFKFFLSSPLEMVRQKIKRFLIWPDCLSEFPGYYQSAYGKAIRSDTSLRFRNAIRIVIDPAKDLIGRCLDEFEWYVDQAAPFILTKKCESIWAENAEKAFLVLGADLDSRFVDKVAPTPIPEPNNEWIDSFVQKQADRIHDLLYRIARKHRGLVALDYL